MNPGPSETVKQLYDLHNQHRVDKGLGLVKRNTLLEKAAAGHAKWMAENNTMSHKGKNGSSFWDRVKAEGYRGRGGGENIAAGYRSQVSVFRAWLNSPGHRRNIENKRWTHIGLAVHKGRGTTLFWCAVFAYGGPNGPNSNESELEILILPEPIEGVEAAEELPNGTESNEEPVDPADVRPGDDR